jgi:hypothetical protein
LSQKQVKQQEELKNAMAEATIMGTTALKKAYEEYGRDAVVPEPVNDTLKRDIEAIGEARTHLCPVMIPYHLKAYALLNLAQQSLYKKLLVQP